VDLLLRYNPTINAQNKYGNSPLWVAVFYAKGKRDIINLLLDSGADPYLDDYITLNVPPVALSIAPLQKMSLSVRQSYDYF
jgi:ankyrin repeat protein